MDERISAALDYIEDNLSHRVTLEEMSNVAHLSPSQFHRLFKKETNSTPFRFVERLKLTIAHERLIEGEVTVQDLSYELGYQDYETFSRAFKKLHHISPDDLKAISKKIQETSGIPSSDKFIVLTIDASENEDDIKKIVTEFIAEKGISNAILQDALVYKIATKSQKPNEAAKMIKNKYELTELPKHWKKLIL